MMVVELQGIYLRSSDAHGREHGGNLQTIWTLANTKMKEALVYKKLTVEKFSARLIPSWPMNNHQSYRAQTRKEAKANPQNINLEGLMSNISTKVLNLLSRHQ